MGEKWREVGSKKDEMGREIEEEGGGGGGGGRLGRAACEVGTQVKNEQ